MLQFWASACRKPRLMHVALPTNRRRIIERRIPWPKKRTASARKAARSTRLRSIAGSTVDDHRLVVAIVIPVAISILPDHDIVAIPVVTLPDHFSIAIPITVTTDGSNGHAARADTNSEFFR